MKKRILTIVALVTVLGLLVTGTAAAGGNRTAFTGTSVFVDEPDWPERYWEPGRNVCVLARNALPVRHYDYLPGRQRNDLHQP